MKTLFLILILYTTIFANESQNLKNFTKHLIAYKAKDFETSYEILSKLYLTKLSDAKLSFYLGRSTYETGHYEIALTSFERVEILNPKNLRNRLEKARTFFVLKMYKEAELAFKEVLANPNIPQNVRTNIEIYLSKVSNAQKKIIYLCNYKIRLDL